MNRSLFIAALVAAAPAFAQWPDKPKTETKTETKVETKTEAAAPSAPASKRNRQQAAAEDEGSGFGLGIRAAWARPSGGLTADQGLGDSLSWQLPVWLEAGYWFNRNLYAGAYYQYAFGFNNCLAGATCTSHGMRFGVEVLYNFAPTALLQPWAGLGFGYETLSRSISGDDTTAKGFELLNLQVGVDFGLGKGLTIGPFASYQLFGKYTSFTAGGLTNDYANTTGHSWLQVGLKAGFKL